MIIKMLIDLVYSVFWLLTSPIDIPSLSVGVKSYVYQFCNYLYSGLCLLANYCDLSYLFVLLGIVISVDTGIFIYKLIMWIIKKIPMLGIE